MGRKSRCAGCPKYKPRVRKTKVSGGKIRLSPDQIILFGTVDRSEPMRWGDLPESKMYYQKIAEIDEHEKAIKDHKLAISSLTHQI
jgi:hypothetical protein